MTKSKAIGIVSGGLDSLLATRLIMGLGFDVTILHFVIGFEPRHLKNWMEHPDEPPTPAPAIVATGARVEVLDIRAEYMPLLAAPPHGFGGNCNPCIDCHAFMLEKARLRMEQLGAGFVFSGEVLGQRPMSQNKQSLDMVARDSGLGDRLVRPLSGALLAETAPEREGLIRRADLLDIQGRSRQRQIALAKKLGFEDYPSPAGGCLLTDPQFSGRLSELFERRPGRVLRIDDPLLLFVGRHVVLPNGAKVVIGRNEEENLVIERFRATGLILEAVGPPGPTSLVEGSPDEQDLKAAARLTGRYGKGRSQDSVTIAIRSPDGSSREMTVEPGEPDGHKLL